MVVVSTFSELMDRLRIKVASPDGTVKLRFDSKGAAIVLTEGCLERHSEQSLAAAVDRCLESLSRAYDSAKDGIFDKSGGAPAVERRGVRKDDRLERYWAELAAIRVQGISSRGFVTMERVQGRVTTVVAPRALTRCNTGDMEAELNGALSEVSQRYSAAVTAAYCREYFTVEVAKLPPFLG
ncbi:hypothetical protein [Stackebrandtia nassauensis]|uniref:Uncharacterized protein n=1 Tax=Stackebrandtia nassauensis (strain DSM 44728 / CIP 108903 / NRRL B-16338 / NBRC 102104 / LLR-40K-21) TaxID=446470 RepID=D3PUX2_STANL|nr:hypothetical protein [Stackebrandtia nassauensis]ADD44996.1 hypothetical protein Snas_5363 [Stackebrandtia nassauensis DSM 44728]